MNPLRALTVAGVVGAATLASGLLADLPGAPGNVAHGQTLMTRTPSVLAAPSGYASAPAYYSPPSHYRVPTYHAAPAYNTTPTYALPPAPSPSGFSAYPTSGYRPIHTQAERYPYQSTGVQSFWPYVRSDDGQATVLLGRSESQGGPPLAPSHAQTPTPALWPAALRNQIPMPRTPRASIPIYQTPNNQMQPQTASGYAMPVRTTPGPMAPGYTTPGYTTPGYTTPGYTTPGYTTPGYTTPGYPDGCATCDVWVNGDAKMYGPPAVRKWFGSLGGVLMTRDHGDHFTFSYGTGNEADQRTDTRNADMGWETGFDVRFGRYFNCQQNAIEAVYWSLFPDSQSTQTLSTDVLGQLNGILNWSSLDYGGVTADNFVNVAPGDDGIHTLTREYEFHNLELNLWRFCGNCGTGKCNCSRLRNNWLIGVRYFRFDENLLFISDANDWNITYENDEIFYNIDLENHLIGFQFGNESQYCVSDRLTADLGIKLGIYANQINHISEIGGNLGVATINNGPFIGEQFYIDSSKNDVAFLGEVNLGLRYRFSCCWTGTVGYRALAVTGVAMPADQIYSDLRGINDVENIDSSRGLILHGGYAGIEYNW